MGTNRISASVSDQARETIFAAIKTLQEKLPFLIDLTPQERRSLPRLGDKSIAFWLNRTQAFCRVISI